MGEIQVSGAWKKIGGVTRRSKTRSPRLTAHLSWPGIRHSTTAFPVGTSLRH
jgi:hypothetical protein